MTTQNVFFVLDFGFVVEVVDNEQVGSASPHQHFLSQSVEVLDPYGKGIQFLDIDYHSVLSERVFKLKLFVFVFFK